MPDTPDPAAPHLRLDESSVEELNQALGIYRRFCIELLGIFILIPLVLLGMSRLSSALAPPYGLYFLGWDLTTWGLLAVLALMFGLFWLRGRQLATILHGPGMAGSPFWMVLNGIGVIAERAEQIGMEWSGFLGPLRNARRKG